VRLSHILAGVLELVHPTAISPPLPGTDPWSSRKIQCEADSQVELCLRYRYGAQRCGSALTNIDAAIAVLRRRQDVAPGPVLIGGQSRGGVLSVAYAGMHPEQILGVINFVGGWVSRRRIRQSSTLCTRWALRSANDLALRPRRPLLLDRSQQEKLCCLRKSRRPREVLQVRYAWRRGPRCCS
jgi:dienelactone hydrolase